MTSYEALSSGYRTSRDARMRSFTDDEWVRKLSGGRDRVRIDVPAITTNDLKQAV